MNTQDNKDIKHLACDGIDVFMKEEAIKDQRFYAAKVAFKGPQLLNGMAPSYEELNNWITMGPITRMTNYSFYPTERSGALFRRIMADIEQSDKRRLAGMIDQPKGFLPMSESMVNLWAADLDNLMFPPSLFATNKTPLDDATVMTFEKMQESLKELMKNHPPAIKFHPFVGYPGKFLPLANPKVDYDIPLFLPDDVLLKGGLGNLKIIFSKKRQQLPENRKYYIDMEAPMDDKWFEAFLNGSQNEEKKDD